MKRKRVAAACLVVSMALLTLVAEARDYEVSKKAGDYRVDVSIDRNPPIVADNHMTIRIRAAGGGPVTDARVSVNYWMPPMPGMPPMNYTTQAVPKGAEYRATMRLIMSGPWNIVVTISRGGKTASMKFPIDVR